MGMGQGPVELSRSYDLPEDAHKPVDVRTPNSAKAKVSLVGGIAHANESMGQAHRRKQVDRQPEKLTPACGGTR